MISDDLSHWSDIFTWRQHHYQFIVNHFDTACLTDQVGLVIMQELSPFLFRIHGWQMISASDTCLLYMYGIIFFLPSANAQPVHARGACLRTGHHPLRQNCPETQLDRCLLGLIEQVYPISHFPKSIQKVTLNLKVPFFPPCIFKETDWCV